MRHSQLRAFHYTALLGGFSRAAEALFLTQPAISEQVRKLEQEQDVLLISRERKQITLTKQGEKLFHLTKQFFEVEQQIREYLSESSAAVEGTLRIIADSAHHVTGILSRFRKRFPNIRVTVRTGNTGEILDELRAYNAEIGVVGSLGDSRDMISLNLGRSEIIAFAAKGFLPAGQHSLSLSELKDLPLIYRETGSKTRQKLADEAARRKIRLSPVIEAEGREAVREIVASGAGIGFVSRAEFSHDDRLVPLTISDVDIHMSESIVHLAGRREVRLIRAFMEFARASESG
jgi:aminoethylphosphonate catabolism LysR family transcriptional regulator